MLADSDHRLFFRSTFTYKDEDQRLRVLAWLDALEGRTFCRQNRYAEQCLVCDFETARDRDRFDEARSKF